MRAGISTHNSHFYSLFMLTLVTVAILGLAGCGGGGSSSSTTTGSSSIIGSSGQITGFGSIFVNGVRFHTGGAELSFDDGTTSVFLDDNPLNNQTHLSEGMEVEVEGSIDANGEGTATWIVVDSTLDGPIASISQAGDVFNLSILGQTVLAAPGMTVVDDTVLNGSLANLAVGMVIEVHGLPDGNGIVQASFIEWKANSAAGLPADAFELTGNATTLTATTFMIGSQLVDFSGVTPRDGVLAEGSLVEVKGNLNGLTFEATDVEIKNGFDDQPEFEVEGLVTNLTSTTFEIKGQLVDYSNAMFLGGVDTDLANGMKVEAEGPISNGVLMAEKVKFKDNFRYSGPANRAMDVVTIDNPNLSGQDLSVTIDANMTREETTGMDGDGQFRLRARQISGANLLATRARDDAGNPDRQIFQATVVAINNPLVEILDDGSGSGVIVVDTSTINPDDSGESNFEIEGILVTREAFFDALQVGDMVKARWDLTGSSWDEIEIELDD